MSDFRVRDLFNALEVDQDRFKRPFSDDMVTAHKVLLDKEASTYEKERAISLWLQRNQPCLFGRLAAGANRIHYCILNEWDHLRELSDVEIRELIEMEKKLWRQRSLDGSRKPEHGFLLLVASPRVAIAGRPITS